MSLQICLFMYFSLFTLFITILRDTRQSPIMHIMRLKFKKSLNWLLIMFWEYIITNMRTCFQLWSALRSWWFTNKWVLWRVALSVSWWWIFSHPNNAPKWLQVIVRTFFPFMLTKTRNLPYAICAVDSSSPLL